MRTEVKRPWPTEPGRRHPARLEHRARCSRRTGATCRRSSCSRVRAIARGETPNVFTIAFEASWIANRALLLNVCGAAAVLEIIGRMFAHVLVLDAAKIDPHVRELMNEERTGAKKLMTVKPLPLISPGQSRLELVTAPFFCVTTVTQPGGSGANSGKHR